MTTDSDKLVFLVVCCYNLQWMRSPGKVGLPGSPLGEAWGLLPIGLGTVATVSGCVALQYACDELHMKYKLL